MAYRDPFLLGPLPAMVALPGIPVGDGVGIAYQQAGGIAQSLRGRATLDVWATRRAYTFAWPLAYGAEARRLVARARALHSAPLRLLDPLGVNLLPVDVAVAGADERLAPDASPGSWGTPSGGATSLVGDITMPAGTELAGIADVATRWVPTAAGQTLYAADVEWRRVPILGRPLTFSAYAYGTGTVTPRIWPRTASGGYGAVQAGPAVALSASWSRLLVTLPAGNAAPAAHVDLLAAGAATVTTTGWQAEHAAAATPWQIGGNVPEVFVAKFGDGYRALGRRALELELLEAS